MIAAAALLVALASPAQNAATIVIALERTACLGTCPEYTVTLYGDGTVVYDGRRNVRVTGRHTWKIRDDVPEMVREIARAGFFELKDEYTAPIMDLPTTYVTVTVEGRTKRIKDHFGAPPALKLIEARLVEITGAKGYVLVSGEAINRMRLQGWRATGPDAARWLEDAVHGGDADIVSALLDAGADARGRDADGVTLLMKAATSGDAGTVLVLIAHGADATARDRAGRNAADRARDGLADPTPNRTVRATGRRVDFATILKLLTDE